jgi:hypothetical protein
LHGDYFDQQMYFREGDRLCEIVETMVLPAGLYWRREAPAILRPLDSFSTGGPGMNTNNNAANRHDWWWMIEDCDNNPPVPHQSDSYWSGQSWDGRIAQPATALESAYHLAMLPFCQTPTAQVGLESNAAKSRGEPLVGNNLESDFKKPASAFMERTWRHS